MAGAKSGDRPVRTAPVNDDARHPRCPATTAKTISGPDRERDPGAIRLRLRMEVVAAGVAHRLRPMARDRMGDSHLRHPRKSRQ
jgi:hypothetical protein